MKEEETLAIPRQRRAMSILKTADPSGTNIKIAGVGESALNTLNRIIQRKIIPADKYIAVYPGRIDECPATSPDASGRAMKIDLTNSRHELSMVLKDADLIVIVGDERDCENTLLTVGREAKKSCALVVAALTVNRDFEGGARSRSAHRLINVLGNAVDAVICVESCENPLSSKDDAIFPLIETFSDIIFRPGFVNVDFKDLSIILSDAGIASFGIGEGHGYGKSAEAAGNALGMMGGLKRASRILFNVTGGKCVGIKEVDEIAEILFSSESVDADASVIWGQTFDPGMSDDSIKVAIIAS
jgi:cell division protein FtsZ